MKERHMSEDAGHRNRSAETGEFVSDVDAATHPKTTIREQVENRPRVIVGRAVHYVSYGTPGGEFSSQCRAATVTEIGDADSSDLRIGLAVLNPTGLFFHSLADGGCEYSLSHKGGTWHWGEHR
jgi:hypothetical protein